MKYKLSDISRITGGTLSGADVEVRSVVTDSRRSMGTDDAPLFVAIRGTNHDGHRFIADLYRRGVRGFIVEEAPAPGIYPGAGFVEVQRSLRALQDLAADYRASFAGSMVAITGSSGKTTLKEWIARMAPEGMKVFRSPRSYNSQLGVPLSILMMAGDEDMAIIEAGISRPGEMDALAGIIRPDVGILTNVGAAHSENFASSEQKTAEKIKLFRGAKDIIYSGDYAEAGQLLRETFPAARLVDANDFAMFAAVEVPETSGTSESVTDAAVVAGMSGKATKATGAANSGRATKATGAAGAPNADSKTVRRENIRLALAFFDTIGIRPELLASRMAELDEVEMRLEVREGIANSIIVVDKGNADINSLSITLDYARSVAGGRPLTLVLSEIPFASTRGDELYLRADRAMASAGVVRLVAIGAGMRRYAEVFGTPAVFYDTAGDALADLTQDRIAGSAIVVKVAQAAGMSKMVHALESKSHTTVLEIDLDAMTANLNHYRALVGGGVKIMAMVKASGYGNGDYEVAAMLQSQGVDYLAVAFADEGVRLRERGITMPIVVLNADSDSFELMVANRLEPEIYNFTSLLDFVRAVRGSGESAWPVHIKFDTGMHRLGFVEGDLDRLVAELVAQAPYVVVRSVFSHLASADTPGMERFTLSQIELFRRMGERLAVGLRYRPLMHILNTAGMERYPQARMDMCRLGLGLYGISPHGEGGITPVSRLTTRIVQIKELGAGEAVGYGCAGKLTVPSRVATIPIGYADGLRRGLGEGRWSVSVGGRRAPIVGRVCMDSCMVDITGIPAAEGDTVVVFGPEAGLGVEDMARVLGTIPYEIMTSVSGRVKRIYTKE